MKTPYWLLEIDPNGTIKKDYEGWVATVFGEKFRLGQTKSEISAALSCTEVLNEMRAIPINLELGLKPKSLTGFWVARGYNVSGELYTLDDGKRDSLKIIHRHQCTNYDQLLQEGYSKEEARLNME